MQFIEFQVFDKYVYTIGRNADGTVDVARQTVEMTAHMNKIAKEREERDRLGLPPLTEWNPFPGWAQKVVEELAAAHRSKLQFDDENRTYKMRIKGARHEYEKFYKEFCALRDAAKPTDEHGLKWLDQYELRAVATREDENEALYELDSHHSGYPSTQARGGGQRHDQKTVDKEQAARAQAAQA